ncbi:MAG: hypothetical protein WDW36_005933 [Sanguina aurantia]
MSDANPPRGPLAKGASSGAPGPKAPPRHPASISGADLGDASAFPLLRRHSVRIDGVVAPSPTVRFTEPLTAVTTEVTDAAAGMPMLGDASHQSVCAYSNAAAQPRLEVHEAGSPGLGIVGSPSSWCTVVTHGLLDVDHSSSRPPAGAGAGLSPRSQHQPSPPPPPQQQLHRLQQQEAMETKPLNASTSSPCLENSTVLSPELKFLAEQQRLYPAQQQQQQQQQPKDKQERDREERKQATASQASLADVASLSSHAINPSEDQGSMSEMEVAGQTNASGSSSKAGADGAPGGWWLLKWGQGGSSKTGHSPMRKGAHAGSSDDTKHQLAMSSTQIQNLQREVAVKLEEVNSSRKEQAAAVKAANVARAAVDRANMDLSKHLSEARRTAQTLTADLSSVQMKLQQALSVGQTQQESLLRKDAKAREMQAEVDGLEEQLGMARQESSNAEFAMQDYIARLEVADERVKQLQQAAAATCTNKQAAAAAVAAAEAAAAAAAAAPSLPGSRAGSEGPPPAHRHASSESQPMYQHPSAPDPATAGVTAASGSAQTPGGSREAAMLRNMLPRFSHDSFEIGMGPQQVAQLLEVLYVDVQNVTRAVMAVVKPQQTGGSTTEDFVMLCSSSSGDRHSGQAPVSEDDSQQRYQLSLHVSSQVTCWVFNTLMARPLAAVNHQLQYVEEMAQAGDMCEASLLASLMCSEACGGMHTRLLNARDGGDTACNDMVRARSLDLGRHLASLYHCYCIAPADLEMLIYRSLLVGSMIPVVHPSLRLFCTAASQAPGQLQPFNATLHRQVHEVPGLSPSHPVARVVIGSLLPGVGFVGASERLLRERVFTWVKQPCPE